MTLYSYMGATPAPLPHRIILPDGQSRTDPATFTPDELAAAGYIAAPPPPAYDPATTAAPIWHDGMWVVRDLTTEEIAALQPPPPAPRALTRLQFVTLVQQAGGMTDEQLVAAHEDPNLKPLWIKLTMATAVERDDPATTAGLQAMQALGHLPSAQAVTDAWPT